MKIFFCGQKSFGHAVLRALHQEGHEIVGVCPPPQQKYYDKTQQYAIRHRLPIVSDCDKLTSALIPEGTELIVAAHSHWYISEQARAKAKHGAIGYHPSLLPRHRGQDAIRWTIAMQDRIAGGTVFRLNNRVDGGEILLQRVQHVAREWSHSDLWRELFPQGVEMLLEAVRLIETGEAESLWREQDERFATFEPQMAVGRLKRNELMMLE